MDSERKRGDSTPNQKPDAWFKFVVVGNSDCGKTELVTRYIGSSNEVKATIGVDFSKKLLKWGNKLYLLNIWDTAGQERFKGLPSVYYRGAQGVLVVFDVTKRETFNSITSWITETKQAVPENTPIVIVANKVDLRSQRVVEEKEIRAFAEKYKIPFYETSTKSGQNVYEIFDKLIHMCLADESGSSSGSHSSTPKIIYAKRLSKEPVNTNPIYTQPIHKPNASRSITLTPANAKKPEVDTKKCCT